MPLGGESSSDSDDDDILYSTTSGLERVTDAKDMSDQRCCLAYISSLLSLAAEAPQNPCGICGLEYNIETKSTGTALFMTWVGIPYN